MNTILDKIVMTKRGEILAAKRRRSMAQLEACLAEALPVRYFFAALSGGKSSEKNKTEKYECVASQSIKLIAEVKKASPSAGLIRKDFDPVQIAKIYEQHGASCISVLTDESYFQGSLDYLTAIRRATSLPLLRKDFILDRYQLLEARVAGADGVLLIAECLPKEDLKVLFEEAVTLGMTPLVELYDPANLTAVLDTGAKLIGVNNRNLHTFEVDLQHTLNLREKIPQDCILVGESGICTNKDVAFLAAGGVDAILVGESLMRNEDIGQAVDQLLGR